MAWNPYQDQKNRAFSNILTSLFPEQTKTLPRILAWSLIFLADLILMAGGAYCLGLLEDFSRVASILMGVTCIGAFWLQGKIWGVIIKRTAEKE